MFGVASPAPSSAGLTRPAAHPGTTEVRIVAEARTRYQEVIALMDVARAAGLANAALEGAGDEPAVPGGGS